METTEEKLFNVDEKLSEIAEKRATVQLNLSALNTKLAEGRLPQHYFKKILEAKDVYKHDILKLNKESNVLKRERKELNLILDKEKYSKEKDLGVDLKQELLDVKQKYFEFYRDKTRIASMRKMASDIIIDLDKILKKV